MRWRAAAAALLLLGAASCTGGNSGGTSPAGGNGATTTPTAVEHKTAALGDKVPMRNGESVQVYTYEPNTAPTNPFSKAQPGNSFAAIDVEGCAGIGGSRTGVLNPFYFTLTLADGTRVQTSIPVKEPALPVGPQPANECRRGFVTYEVSSEAKAVAVVLDAPGLNITWSIR